jgi:RHS repeat-associated protein
MTGDATLTGVGPLTYDVENRLSGMLVKATNATINYGYDAQNRRIVSYRSTGGDYTVYFYGAGGQRLQTYSVTVNGSSLSVGVVASDVYFGGRRLAPVDRVGSARSLGGQNASYFPYGEDKVSNVGGVDGWGFGTYWKDSASGLSYAMNRYYSSALGRFTSPDPYRANDGGPGDASDPASWNRYAYVSGDPTNRFDPAGTCWAITSSAAGVTSEYFDCGYQLATGQSSTSRGPYYVPLDPLPLSPYQIWALAKGYAEAVLSPYVHLTDCQALAGFAQDLSDNSLNNAQFVNAFRNFVPAADPSVVQANAFGVPIGGVGKDDQVIMLLQGGTSGFVSSYQEMLDPKNQDQVHHFAAFFQLGYQAGSLSGAIAAFIKDLYPLNPGDINLGIAASALGAELRQGLISQQDVSTQIANGFCKQ